MGVRGQRPLRTKPLASSGRSHLGSSVFVTVYCGNHLLYLHLSQQWGNSLEHSGLRAIVCEDTPHSRRTRVPYEDLDPIHEMDFHFDLEPSMATGWRDVRGDNRFYATADLAQQCLSLLLDCIRDRRLGEKQNES